MVLTTACALPAGGCGGDRGHIDLGQSSEIHRIEISAPAGSVQIVGDSETSGLVGTHFTGGIGARGPAAVALDSEGVLRIEAACAPFLPCSVDISMAVGSQADVWVDMGSGEVKVHGVDRAEVQLDRGDVHASVHTDLVARVGKGSLSASTGAESHVQAVVASGDVDLRVPPGEWQVEAVAARLQVAGVASDRRAIGRLSVHAPSGAVRIVGTDALARR